MRTKLITSGSDHALVLSVLPSWREKVLADGLEWIENYSYPLFAQVRHDMRGRSVSSIYYTFTGMRCLTDLLAAGVYEELLSSILVGVADAISVCILEGMNAGLLFLDSSWIYLASDGLPRFAYLPLDGHGKRGSRPEGHLARLLEQMTDESLTRRTNRAKEWSDRIAEYSERPVEQITLRSYCSLVEGTLGIPLSANTRKAVHLLNERDPRYVAELHLDRSEKRLAKGVWRGVSSRGSFDAFQREGTGGARSDEGGGREPRTDRVRDVPTSVEEVPTAERRSPISGQPSIPVAYYLIMIADGSQYVLAEGSTTKLGRGTQSDIQLLGNPKISRVHAVMRCNRENVVICDLKSANGTWIGQRRLMPNVDAELVIGTKFSLANEDFIVRRESV